MTDILTYEDLLENLSFLDDWEERYKYVLDLGKALAPFPEAHKNEAYLVKGCVSQVWLDYQKQDDKFIFFGDSDSHLVRGLIAILFIIYADKSASDILKTDFKACFEEIGLAEHLTPQRSNGLFSMVQRIQDIASS